MVRRQRSMPPPVQVGGGGQVAGAGQPVASASRAGDRRVVRPSGRKEKGKEVTHSLPLSMYTASVGLRQDRGRAAQSTVRGQNHTDGSDEESGWAATCWVSRR